MNACGLRVFSSLVFGAILCSPSSALSSEGSSVFPAAFGVGAPRTENPFEAARSESVFTVPSLFPRLAADAVTGASKAEDPVVDATTGASMVSAGKSPSIFSDRVSFHKFAGWTSGALFLAAGVVGTLRFYNLMRDGHDYRDSLGMTEENYQDSLVSAKISELWDDSSGQALRWTHVGLIAAGETLYLSNAVTGIEMFTPDGPGLTRSDLHRYAFFVHVSLMLAETILGVMTTEALRKGNHEAISESIGPAHIAIGFAIPAAIFTSGALIETGWLTSD